jgi:hypothetical protein
MEGSGDRAPTMRFPEQCLRIILAQATFLVDKIYHQINNPVSQDNPACPFPVFPSLLHGPIT